MGMERERLARQEAAEVTEATLREGRGGRGGGAVEVEEAEVEEVGAEEEDEEDEEVEVGIESLMGVRGGRRAGMMADMELREKDGVQSRAGWVCAGTSGG